MKNRKPPEEVPISCSGCVYPLILLLSLLTVTMLLAKALIIIGDI